MNIKIIKKNLIITIPLKKLNGLLSSKTMTDETPVAPEATPETPVETQVETPVEVPVEPTPETPQA